MRFLKEEKLPKIKQPKLQPVKLKKLRGVGLPKHPRIFGAKKK